MHTQNIGAKVVGFAFSLLLLVGAFGCNPIPAETHPVAASGKTIPGFDLFGTDSTDPGDPAPVLNGKLIQALSYKQEGNQALLIGLPGSVPAGVTMVFARLPNDEIVEIGVTINPENPHQGSFRHMVSGVTVGDDVELWGDGPGYTPGPSIYETVIHWYKPFPDVVTCFESFDDPETNQTTLYIGSLNGLYVYDLDADEPSIPKLYTIESGLPNNMVWSLAVEPNGDLWVGTGRGLARVRFGEEQPDFERFYFGECADSIPHLDDDPEICRWDWNNKIMSLVSLGPESLWIGTWNGLYHLISSKTGANILEHFTSSDPTETRLPANQINVLASGGPNELWIGTVNGLSRFNYAKDHFSNYTKNDGLPHPYIHSLAVAGDQSLWIGTRDGLGHLPEGEVHISSYLELEGVSGTNDNMEVTSLALGEEGEIWAGTNHGLHRITSSGSGLPLVTNIDVTEEQVAFDDQSIKALKRVTNHGMWVGTEIHRSGLVQLQSDAGDSFEPISHRVDNALSNNWIRSLALGFGDEIWIGTDHDLNHLSFDDDGSARFSHVSFPELPHWAIQSVVVGMDGDVWVGTDNGLGRIVTGPNNERQFFSYLSEKDPGGVSGDHKYIKSLVVTRSGDIWAGTDSFGLYRITPASSEENIPTCMPPDCQNFTMENTNGRLPSNNIKSIVEVSNGDLWVGTKEDGLSRISFSEGREPSFESFSLPETDTAGNEIWSLAAGVHDDLWVGTEKSLIHVTYPNPTSSPLPSPPLTLEDGGAVTALAVESNGDLWVGTDNGLFHRTGSAENRTIQKYDSNDGLPCNFISSLALGSEGQLYIGTYAGLILFNNDFNL